MARAKKAGAAQEAPSGNGSSAYPLGPTVSVLVGSVLILVAILTQLREIRFVHFPFGQARVVRSEVVQLREHRGQLPALWGAEVEYEYQVGGKAFTSRRYSNDERPPTFPSKIAAEKFLLDFPKAAPVSIQYDPKDPAQSFLSLRLSFLPMKLGFLPALLVLFGLVGLVREYRRSPS